MRTDRLLASSLSIAVASSLHAQTHVFVDDDAPSGGDGLSWNTAFSDLHDAIDLASQLGQSRGEIRIAGGVYTPDRGTGDRSMAFEVPAVTPGGPVYNLVGGFAGHDSPATPDDRDPVLFPSVLDADIDGDGDFEAYALLIIHEHSASGAPVSAVVLDGLRFRGAVDGGIRALGGKSVIVMTGCVVEDSANFTSEAMFVDDDIVHLTDCVFENNASGALRADDSAVYINGCVFKNNYGRSGSAVHAFSGTLDIQNSTFSGNKSTDEGGAVYARFIRLSIAKSEFLNNEAGSGGAIYVSGFEGVFESTVFEDNSAVGDGGAILSLANGEIYDCSFARNTAADGGAVYGRLTIRDSEFTNNSTSAGDANSQGGAAYVYGTRAIENCQFVGNASGFGGGVFVPPHISAIEISDSLFSENTAISRGGGAQGVNTIRDSVFERNSAESIGGAISETDSVFGCTITNNSAGFAGGGLFDVAQIGSSNIEHNQAQYGGGLYVSVLGRSVVSDTVLFDNKADVYGSAIRSRSDIDLLRCTVTQSDPLSYTPIVAIDDGLGWIESSIVWDERFPGLPAVHLTGETSLAILYSALRLDDSSISTGPTANVVLLGGNVEFDPGFADIVAGDLRLTGGSPCIDAGFNHGSDLPDTNAYAEQRIVLDDSGVPNSGFGETDYLDIGAIEFRGTSCLPDVNRDGALTRADFTAWIDAYNTGNPLADQNRDGRIDQGDFTAWINNYTTGCP